MTKSHYKFTGVTSVLESVICLHKTTTRQKLAQYSQIETKACLARMLQLTSTMFGCHQQVKLHASADAEWCKMVANEIQTCRNGTQK